MCCVVFYSQVSLYWENPTQTAGVLNHKWMQTWPHGACSVARGSTVRASDREKWRVENFDMKRRSANLPVLLRSNNWREWNMRRWTMTGKKTLIFPCEEHVAVAVEFKKNYLEKLRIYSCLHRSHPGIIFKMLLGAGLGCEISVGSAKRIYWKRHAYRQVWGTV